MAEALNTLVQNVYDQLMIDIAPTREGEEDILLIKTNNAYREVCNARRYPSSYDDETILTDMEHYFTDIYNLAMFDFNMRGAEGQSIINENGEYRSFVKRVELLKAIVPICVLA